MIQISETMIQILIQLYPYQNKEDKKDRIPKLNYYTYSRGSKWDCIRDVNDAKAPENIPIILLKELSLSFGLLFVYLKSSKNFSCINVYVSLSIEMNIFDIFLVWLYKFDL